MTTDVILFGNARPAGVYNLVNIYDPDIDGSDPIASGKIVPAIKSIIVDSGNVMYIVTAVDPTTYKVTMVSARIVVDDDTEVDEFISYGNEQYMLYYDNRVNPTKLVIDSKLILFGTNSVEYKLFKTTDDITTSIAIYIDEHGDINGDRIPMAPTQVTGITKPANCHTLTTLSDGDIIKIHIYDGSGILTCTTTLTCKQASILNDLTAAANPVTEFNATASQMVGDDWILYVGQAPEHLSIFPEIVYSDGTKEYVTINSENCFLYGMEDVVTNYPGLQYNLLLKYYLAANVESTIADDDERFITIEKLLYTDVKSKHEFSKISVIPIWNSGTSKWVLKYFAYYDARNTYEDVTNSIAYTAGMVYDDTITMEQQTFQLELPYTAENDAQTIQIYQQAVTLTLKTIADVEPFLIAPSTDATFVYGSSDAMHKRPRIEYDATLEQYFIPTSLFSNSDIFIENFYINATPPYLTETEIEAPTPTYFTIREVSSGRVLLTTPIAIASYELAFNMLNVGTANQFVDSTVVVEFLIEDGESWSILFGVAVEIKLSVAGYNL